MPNDDQNKQDKEKMSRQEAGKKGGEATKEEYGEEFYSEIGHKGGKTKGENQDVGESTGMKDEDTGKPQDTSNLWTDGMEDEE